MKKWLISGFVLLAVVAAVGVPAGIGWLIQSQATPRLESRLGDGSVDWNRGWFRSTLNIDDPGIQADVDFRHAPLSPPGWLSVDGRVILAEPIATIDLSGRISLSLNARVEALAPSLQTTGPVAWRYAAPRVELRAEDNTLFADGRADTVFVRDALGNRIALANPMMALVIEQTGNPATNRIALTLDVTASRAGLPESRLAIAVGPLTPGAAELLAEALAQLVSSGTSDAGGGLAAVGLASAWQQAGASGMVVDLDKLSLDGDFQLSGRWAPGDQTFSLTGSGPRETLVEWWSPLAGLTEAIPPSQARQAVSDQLDRLVADGLVRQVGDRIEVALKDAPPGAAN